MCVECSRIAGDVWGDKSYRAEVRDTYACNEHVVVSTDLLDACYAYEPVLGRWG